MRLSAGGKKRYVSFLNSRKKIQIFHVFFEMNDQNSIVVV